MGLTLVQVAESLGVDWHTIARCEHGKNPLTPRTRNKIVTFLGYDPTDKAANPTGVS